MIVDHGVIGIARAVADAAGDQAVGERLVAIHCDLDRGRPRFGRIFELVPRRQHIADRIGVTGLKRHQRGVEDALVLAAEFLP